MEIASSSKRKRSLYEEEGEDLVDRISSLPDGVLGGIVSLLPTMDGARTQVLSSRWRHIWRSAPLNLDLVSFTANKDGRCQRVSAGEISRILSAHQGPGRRFRTELQYLDLHGRRPESVLDGWLRSPDLDNLEELEFHYGYMILLGFSPLPPPPASVRRFSSTLRVASFAGCGFSEENSGALYLPVPKQLSPVHATISESSLQALRAGCPVLQSLLLSYNNGYSRVRIVPRTLVSIGVFPGSLDGRLQHLILEDAPSLERLLIFRHSTRYAKVMDVSVISAPKLDVFGPLSDDLSRLDIGTTVFQTILAGSKYGWSREYQNFVRTHDTRLKKVVLLNYQGNKAHVNFAKFFVLNAKVLESIVLELENGITLSTEWIERQQERLHTKDRASKGAQVDFVYREGQSGLLGHANGRQAHDLSTAYPFVRFHAWSI